MDPSWQALCDILKDPNVSEDDKEKIRILAFMHTESRLLMESYPTFYPTFNMSTEDMQKANDKQIKAADGEMDPSWKKLYDDLKDPNVPKEAKDRIWTFIHNESRLFMEFAYPSLNINVKNMQKTIDELKKRQENGRKEG